MDVRQAEITPAVVIREAGVVQPQQMQQAGRIRPYASKFLGQFVPAPNVSEPGINYRGPALAAPINQDQYVARIDHTFSTRDSLFGSYIYNIQSDDTVPTFGFDTRGNRARAQNISLSEVHVFSGAVVNEVRAGWHRFFGHEFFGTTDRPELDIANIIGLPGVSSRPRDFGAPAFNAGYVLPTVRPIGPRDRLNQLWQITTAGKSYEAISDNVSARIGSHALKIGMPIARRNWTFDEAVNPRGTFNFDGTVTAAGVTATRDHQFADFLLGLATSAQVSIEPFATRMNNWWHSYYVQDDWKLRPNLTLNFGLRYEYFAPPVLQLSAFSGVRNPLFYIANGVEILVEHSTPHNSASDSSPCQNLRVWTMHHKRQVLGLSTHHWPQDKSRVLIAMFPLHLCLSMGSVPKSSTRARHPDISACTRSTCAFQPLLRQSRQEESKVSATQSLFLYCDRKYHVNPMWCGIRSKANSLPR